MSRYFCALDPLPDELMGKTDVVIKKPKRATKRSAGYDIFAPYSFELRPGQETVIATGIGVHMNPDEFLAIYPRSGLGFKYYVRLANTVGIIDQDYEKAENGGHIMVKIRNESVKSLIVKQGEAFCQAIFQKFLLVDGDDLDVGEDRTGGFGSTSNK